MTLNTERKIQTELNSLQGLSIINLLCSGLAFAFGVYFLMPNLIQIAETLTVPPIDTLGLMVLGGLAFALAFRWLISTAEIIDVQSKLNNSLHKHKKEHTLDDEALTGLIINMTAAYRENKTTLKVMVTVSKVACALFTLGASIGIISLISGGASGWPFWMGLLNAGVCYGVAAACYIIPHFFAKYSQVWDQRLEGTTKAEAELKKALGEA
jgi:hypothetical protein